MSFSRAFITCNPIHSNSCQQLQSTQIKLLQHFAEHFATEERASTQQETATHPLSSSPAPMDAVDTIVPAAALEGQPPLPPPLPPGGPLTDTERETQRAAVRMMLLEDTIEGVLSSNCYLNPSTCTAVSDALQLRPSCDATLFHDPCKSPLLVQLCL